MGIRLEAAVVRSISERLQCHALGREYDNFARLAWLSLNYRQAGIIGRGQMDWRRLSNCFHLHSVQTVRRPNGGYSDNSGGSLDPAGFSQRPACEAAYQFPWNCCLHTCRIECRLYGVRLALLPK